MRLSKARKEIVTAVMKDSIAEAAGSVLEEHGIAGMTMDRVATTAGLATGSLYNYFQDKNDLLRFFYARVVEPGLKAIEEAVNTEAPAPKKLEAILRMAREYATKHKGLIRIMAGAGQDFELRRKVRPRLLRILTTVVEQGIREGVFRPHNPVIPGRMLLGCLSELFELQAEGASSEEVDEFVEILIDAVLHGYCIHTEKGRCRKGSTDE